MTSFPGSIPDVPYTVVIAIDLPPHASKDRARTKAYEIFERHRDDAEQGRLGCVLVHVSPKIYPIPKLSEINTLITPALQKNKKCWEAFIDSESFGTLRQQTWLYVISPEGNVKSQQKEEFCRLHVHNGLE